MNKSLTPFIILFSLVILITVIIINSGSSNLKVVEYNDDALQPSMTLSPFTERRRQRNKLRLKRQNQPNIFNIDVDGMLNSAKRLLSEGNIHSAEDSLRTILVFEPENQRAMYLMGGICIAEKRYGEAEYIFDQLAERYPDNIAFYNNLVLTLEKQKKYKKAIVALQKIMIVYPAHPILLLNLARMQSAEQNIGASIQTLEKAYEILGGKLLPLTYDPLFDNLRASPEFLVLVQKMEKDEAEAKDSSSATETDKKTKQKPD